LIALVGGALITACGGSSSSTTETVGLGELHAAKKAGEERAREQDRMNNLQKQVRQLKHRMNHGARVHVRSEAAAPVPAEAVQPPEAAGPLRSFHAPSGNVSCEVFADGASCTVESIAETFLFEAGEPARIESGTALPRDLGELVGYGETVSSGSISCEVPPSDVPRGISCSDSASGHGFEASRIPSRQSAY
jgi:hypothetical protein